MHTLIAMRFQTTPARRRNLHLDGMVRRHAKVECALGEITLVASGEAVVGLYFSEHWHPPAQEDLGDRVALADDSLIGQAAAEIDEYLAGTREHFDVALAPAGDEFSQRVWDRLTRITYGTTTTYGALAREFGDRHLAQRIGQVVGRNPLCVFIPCHRVLGADGSLTGYAGGLERKRHLLELEEPPAAAASRLF